MLERALLLGEAMSKMAVPHSGVMEGKGAYNRHSRIPAAGGSLAIPHLVAAAGRIALDEGERAVVIADYGSSEGKNSLAPLRLAILALRRRVAAGRPIMVCHTDLPSNDFNSLFDVVNQDPESYAMGDPDCFPCAIGCSFYRQLLPSNSVDLGWSSYAAVWLSQTPVQIPDHFFIPCATGATRAALDKQAALDWAHFLSLRARELRPGGRLVVALPSLDHDGSTHFSTLMDHANATLGDLVDAGVISALERGRMTIASCPRRQQDLVAPFGDGGAYQGLVIEHVSTERVPDTAWIDYERDRDAMALATKRALFFRVIFIPSLAKALAPERTAEERQDFAQRLEDGLRHRLLTKPALLDNLVGIIVLAKQDTGT
jgi:hypothetical protein